MVDGPEFWISCKRPAFLGSFNHLQVIQNLAPSTIMWRQCDIRIGQSLGQGRNYKTDKNDVISDNRLWIT